MRQAWRMHPVLQVVLKRDRLERPYVKKDGTTSSKPRVWFKCTICDKEYKRNEVDIDHVEPVGPTPGSQLAPPELTWDMFIARMFCGPENLRIVCKPCHKEHTMQDMRERREAIKRLNNAV